MNLNAVEIIGVGHYAPEQILTNKELSEKLDISDEWIYSRTGIKSRHIASETQNTSDVAFLAATQALEFAKIKPSELDLIIVCTITPDGLCPATANVVQMKLQATNSACFDLFSSCSGFVFGLSTAYQYLATGMYKTALVIGVDLLSRFTNYQDKNSCILFGDGAGSAVLRVSENNMFKTFLLGSEGNMADLIKIPSSGTQKSDLPPFLTMKGREVFKWAVNKVPEVILQGLKKANLKLHDIDYFIIHQANKRIIDAIAHRLHIPDDKVLSNIIEFGNTSAASIPIILAQNVNKGKIKKGHKVLLVGFGSGLSWGLTILEF